MTRHPLSILAVVALASCAANGESPDDDPSSAIIVTTTSVAPVAIPATATPGDKRTTDEQADDTTPDSSAVPAGTTTETVGTAAPDDAPPAASATVGKPSVGTELVAEFRQPVDLAVRPGDDAFFIVQQSGQVVRFDGSDSSTVLDVAERISTGNEQGLLGLAFSPDADLAYIDFTDTNGTTTIVEYRVGADGSFDTASERVLLTVDQPYSNHNAGDLAFGPDGLLYVTLGDGGSGGDPERRADDPTSLLGSILRIDPVPDADAPYTIPADNPFADRADARGEIYAYGLRNPFRFSFDRTFGGLWLGDVGQDDAEEINYSAIQGRGANFGWKCFEGALPNDGTSPPCTPPGHVPPVLEYDLPGCQAITGGYVVRDPGLPTLLGRYLYADYCVGELRSMDLRPDRDDRSTGIDVQDFTLAAFGEDACGRIYVVQLSGAVSRLIDGAASACPAASVPPVGPGLTPPVLDGDGDGDGVPNGADRCPGAAHRTSDGCAPFVRLRATTPQRVAISKRLSVREVVTNVSGRLTLRGRLRRAGRLIDVRLGSATLSVVGGRAAKGSLGTSLSTRRAIRRLLARGRLDVDVTATIAATRATARVRVRAR